MEAVRTYLLQVTCAAVVCGMIHTLVGKKGTVATGVRLLSGIFLTMTLLGPLVNLHLAELPDLLQEIEYAGSSLVTEGENSSRQAMAKRIKEKTEAYILDKANSLDARVSVTVSLTEDTVPVPCRVVLRGSISPYARMRLKEIITQDLGIPEEGQTWTVTN